MVQRTTSIGSESQSGAWGEPDATTFMIRGDDYMKTRRKVPSDKAIYRSGLAIITRLCTDAVLSQPDTSRPHQQTWRKTAGSVLGRN